MFSFPCSKFSQQGGMVIILNPVISTMHCCRSPSEWLYLSPAGRLGLECEDDFSSPMQVSFVPGPGVFLFFLPLFKESSS